MSESVTLKLTLREANLIAKQLKEANARKVDLLNNPHYPDTVREGETKHSVRQATSQFILEADAILRKLGA